MLCKIVSNIKVSNHSIVTLESSQGKHIIKSVTKEYEYEAVDQVTKLLNLMNYKVESVIISKIKNNYTAQICVFNENNSFKISTNIYKAVSISEIFGAKIQLNIIRTNLRIKNKDLKYKRKPRQEHIENNKNIS